MKVELLTLPHKGIDPEYYAGFAAATCVGRTLYDCASTDGYVKNLEAALRSNHLSILEHLPLTWSIEGISRACLAQLTRHRHMSFSVQSQRYSKVKTWAGETDGSYKSWYVLPKTIDLHDQPYISKKYEQLMDEIADFYNDMLEQGVPAEDARMILPNACKTSIVVSMNARSFLEAAQKRLCNKAQWEIRELFWQMRESIKDIYPSVYELAIPNCCKEYNPCGRPWGDRSN